MSVTQEIGRAVIAKGSQDYVECVSEYLTYSGVESLICCEDECYFVTVDYEDEEKARKLYKQRFSGCAARTASPSPSFSNALKKLGEINDSAAFFIICGGAVFVLAVLRVLNIIGPEKSSIQLTIVELVLGFFFFVFGLQIFFKSLQAKKALAKENAYTLKVIGWFLGTYSSDDLDKLIEARGSDLPPGEQRRELIRKLINREFEITDGEYLTYLTEEAYTAMYHTRKLSGQSGK